jgi:hypothetical protein
MPAIEWVHQDRFEDAEDRRVRADSQGERQDGDDSGGRRSRQRSEGVSEILPHGGTLTRHSFGRGVLLHETVLTASSLGAGGGPISLVAPPVGARSTRGEQRHVPVLNRVDDVLNVA